MVTYSRTMCLAIVLDRSQLGWKNINQILNCLHVQLSPLTSILFSISVTMSEDHYNAWKCHHAWPKLVHEHIPQKQYHYANMGHNPQPRYQQLVQPLLIRIKSRSQTLSHRRKIRPIVHSPFYNSPCHWFVVSRLLPGIEPLSFRLELCIIPFLQTSVCSNE